ncbi:MAG: hypothetical protein K5864_07900 [Bacteroidales bacterium]|nr:hypothetical protein [Bacteroidales bacterium]
MANKLTEIIDSGRVSHAQLFLGDSTSGSLALAIAYAQYLNCEHRQHYDTAAGHPDALRADSCGECPSCKKYEQLVHSDLHLYFPTTTTDSVKSNPCCDEFQQDFRKFLTEYRQQGTLEDWYAFMQTDNKQGQLRERDAESMVNTMALTTYENGYKVLIIWMAEKMSAVVANKILKILEEPTRRTLIILVAEHSDKMLSTILSRAQLVSIPRVHGSDEMTFGEVQVRAENRDYFAQMYVTWMRQLFKLNMASLSAWVDEIAGLGREQQKQFLMFAQESVRECFLCNLAGMPLAMDFGDAKFNSSFPAMITEHNAEGLNNAFAECIHAIERNAYSKIALMELSFRISKLLQRRKPAAPKS